MEKRPLLGVFLVAIGVTLSVILPASPLSADVLRFDTTDIVLHSGQSFDSRAGLPNPFTDVTLSARVTAPSGTVYTVDGFFDGNGSGGAVGNVFKIRISPDEEGMWRWTTTSSRADLNAKSGSFECSGTLPGVFGNGPIVIDPDRRQVFKYREGRPVYLVGKFLDKDAPDERIQFSHPLFSEELSEPEREALFARHKAMSLNKMNVYIANKGDYGHISTTPWIGRDTNNDKTRFDLGRWHTYEQWVLRMRDAGMVSQLWFFADDSQFGDLPDADRKRLIQYGMARLSGYVNTLFTLMLEWQEGWTTTEVNNHANYIHQWNPWARLVTVHGLTGDFSYPTAAWADYMDTQSGNDSGHAVVHSHGLRNRNLAVKPLIQEEFGLGAEDTAHRQRAWAAFTAGAAGSGTGSFLAHLSSFANAVDFERMDPADTLALSANAYVLAEKSMAYVLYLYNGGTVRLDLRGFTANFSVQWYDPRTGTYQAAANVAAGGERSFTAPASGDWVLYLKRI